MTLVLILSKIESGNNVTYYYIIYHFQVEYIEIAWK